MNSPWKKPLSHSDECKFSFLQNFKFMITKTVILLLQIISAVIGGITDLSFDAKGYTWQILNCILTAAYSVCLEYFLYLVNSWFWDLSSLALTMGSIVFVQIYLYFYDYLMSYICNLWQLTLRLVMDKAKQATKSGSLNNMSMVLLNNLLSLPFAIFLIFVLNEWEYVINACVNTLNYSLSQLYKFSVMEISSFAFWQLPFWFSSDVIKLPVFWVVATASGLLGLAISFTSMWFLHQTGPTTYRYSVVYD